MADSERIGERIAAAVTDALCDAHRVAHAQPCPICDPDPCADCLTIAESESYLDPE